MHVCTIGPEATLADVAIELVKHKIGSLLICRHDEQGEMELLGHRHRTRHSLPVRQRPGSFGPTFRSPR